MRDYTVKPEQKPDPIPEPTTPDTEPETPQPVVVTPEPEQDCPTVEWDADTCEHKVKPGSSWAYYTEKTVKVNNKPISGKQYVAYLYAQQLMYNIKDPKGLKENRFLPVGATYVEHSDFSRLFEDEEIMKKYNLTYEQVSYMGDDEPDICILEKVGLACCPADAVDKVKNICHFVSTKDGGRGAVRELCDLIYDSQNS